MFPEGARSTRASSACASGAVNRVVRDDLVTIVAPGGPGSLSHFDLPLASTRALRRVCGGEDFRNRENEHAESARGEGDVEPDAETGDAEGSVEQAGSANEPVTTPSSRTHPRGA